MRTVFAIAFLISTLFTTGQLQAVVGGQPESIDHFPYLVGLEACGAVKIAPAKILTAAHCVGVRPRVGITRVNEDLSIRISQNTSLKFPLNKDLQEDAIVKNIFVHPSYFRSFGTEGLPWDVLGYDVAIVEFRDSKVLRKMEKIPVLTKSLRKKSVATAPGWGAQIDRLSTPEELIAYDKLFKNTPEQAEKYLKSVEIEISAIKDDYYVGSNFSSESLPTRIGKGDSGGPLISIVDNEPYVAGIVAFGDIGGGNNHFTRLDTISGWITNIIEDKATPAPWSKMEDEWELHHRLYAKNYLKDSLPIPVDSFHGTFKLTCQYHDEKNESLCLVKKSNKEDQKYPINSEDFDKVVEIFTDDIETYDFEDGKKILKRNIKCFQNYKDIPVCLSTSDYVLSNLKEKGLTLDFFLRTL